MGVEITNDGCGRCQVPNLFLFTCNELPWYLFINYLVGQIHVLGQNKKGKPITRPDYQAIFLIIDEFVKRDRIDVLNKILFLFEVNKSNA